MYMTQEGKIYLKQLNISLILILLIGLTNLASSQELHQLTTRQITQPTIIEQLPIVQTQTEQTRSSHALPSEEQSWRSISHCPTT